MTQFKRGDFLTCDSPHPGRLKLVYNLEIIEEILEDLRISAKSITEQLGISRERVGFIIHDDLHMWKLSAKWVPKCLNADQKREGWQSSEQFFNFFLARSNDFLSRAIVDHGRNLVISL